MRKDWNQGLTAAACMREWGVTHKPRVYGTQNQKPCMSYEEEDTWVMALKTMHVI